MGDQDEVPATREVLAAVEGLASVFAATEPLVDADSGCRPSPFTEDALRRLRIRGYWPEALA